MYGRYCFVVFIIIVNLTLDYTHSAGGQMNKKVFTFFNVPRLDALKELEVHPLYILQHFGARKDL